MKTYLLRIDEDLWDRFLETIPRSEYGSINQALNDMIKERVKESAI